MSTAPVITASVVLPTYNRAWGLDPAIRSALAQTESSLEVIVLDDASSDQTPAVAAASSDPRVTYHRQPMNVGMVRNWGNGLRLARGEFVTFLSDDDQLEPGFLAHRLAQFAMHGDATVVFSRFEQRSPDGTPVGEMNTDWPTARVLDARELFMASLGKRWFVGASLYRREAVLAVWDGVTDDDLVLDYSLNLQLALRGARGVFIPESDFVMGIHEGQNSRAKRHDVFLQAERLMRRLLGTALPDQMRTPLRRELANWLMVYGRLRAVEGDLPRARGCFRRAILADPRHLTGWRSLARSWVRPDRLGIQAAGEGPKRAS